MIKAYTFAVYSVLFASIGASSIAHAETYVVKPGDTLSELVHARIPGKIWGTDGSLSRVLSLNPNISNPNLIHPEDQIQLEVGTIEDTSGSTKPETAAGPIIEPESTPAAEPTPIESLPTTDTSAAISSDLPTLKDSTFEITPFFGFLTLASQDKITSANAKLSSSYDAGISARYNRSISQTMSWNIHAAFTALDFEQPTSGTARLTGTSKILPMFGLGFEKQLTTKLNVDAYANYEQLLTVRAASTSLVTVDANGTPLIGADLSYDAFDFNPALLGFSVKGAIDLPASASPYSVSTGATYGGKLYLKGFGASNYPMQAGIGFYWRTQSTSITTQTEKNLILNLRFGFGNSTR